MIFFCSFYDDADTSRYPFQGGITHADDNIYLFPYPSNVAKLNENDTKMAQMMVDLWTSFATNGVPTLPRIQDESNPVQWEPFSGEKINFNLCPGRARPGQAQTVKGSCL